MLSSVRFRGFKSYRDAEQQLAPLTVLIGANASGKSNAIEGLRLLSWIGQGNRLGTLRQFLGDQAVRGTMASLGYNGDIGFALGCVTTDDDWNWFEVALRVDTAGDPHIETERVTGPGAKVPLYETVGHVVGSGSDLRVAYNNFARGGCKPQVSCSDQMAVLAQLESAARFEVGHKEAQTVIPVVCGRFRRSVSDILFLDPRPSSMRG